MPYEMSKLLALPFTPCLRVRVGPKPEDVVEISAIEWEAEKPKFIEFCKSITEANEGPSWRELKKHTGGNGLMARLLIALGDMAGVWTMFPRVFTPELWHPQHPMILRESVASRSTVPKPSAGDLERDTKECEVCHRPMGPADSKHHDLVESPDEGTCLECYHDQADEKRKPKTKKASVVKEDEPQLDQDALAAYLRQFQS